MATAREVTNRSPILVFLFKKNCFRGRKSHPSYESTIRVDRTISSRRPSTSLWRLWITGSPLQRPRARRQTVLRAARWTWRQRCSRQNYKGLRKKTTSDYIVEYVFYSCFHTGNDVKQMPYLCWTILQFMRVIHSNTIPQEQNDKTLKYY